MCSGRMNTPPMTGRNGANGSVVVNEMVRSSITLMPDTVAAWPSW